MPSKYVLRDLRKNCSYHVSNRSIETVLFKDDQDYRVFLFYIYIATTALEDILVKYPDLPKRLRVKNLSGEIKVVGYCLLPDHFHILLRQNAIDSLPRFMKRVINGYTSYFNHKYKRAGSVLRGRYKAIMVKDTELEGLAKYLHLHGAGQWSSGWDKEVTEELDQEQIERLSICGYNPAA